MLSGKPPASAIKMTDRQFRLLSEHGRKHLISNQLSKRINILLRSSKGESIASVSREVKVDVSTVKSWRRRWESEYDSLCSFEEGESGAGVSDKFLLTHLLGFLKDLQRSGTPKRITLAQEQQIVALACENPVDHGIEMNRWSHKMLADVAKTKGIIDTISPRYVGVILKKNGVATS